MAGLVPHHSARKVIFGGLKSEISYDEAAFADVDPDIQRMFYGSDDGTVHLDASDVRFDV